MHKVIKRCLFFNYPIFIFLLLLNLMGCQSQSFLTAEELSSIADTQLSCGETKNLILDDLKFLALEKKEMPSIEEFEKSFSNNLKSKHSNLSLKQQLKLTSKVMNWYRFLNENYLSKRQDTKDIVMGLSSLDVEDRTDFQTKINLNKKNEILNDLDAYLKQLDLNCENNSSEVSEPTMDSLLGRQRASEKQMNWASYGAQASMAVAYQSCQSLQVHPLTQEQAAAKGVSIVGEHPDQIGKKRLISDLNLLQKTHPYLFPLSDSNFCFDVYNQPLIYDYGGKPYVNRSHPLTLDFHQNAGSGTSVLGVDCSGFIFSALGSMGLKLKSDRNLRALDVYSWSARSYMNPIESGLSCLSKVTSNSDGLWDGDILASEGHVLMIAKVGTDPFGIKAINNLNECSKVKIENFNFTIIQSSNSKGGVGINQYQASDYFQSESEMSYGIKRLAQYFCEYRLNKVSKKINIPEISLVRHRSDDPKCLDARLQLANEKCLTSCSLL